MMRSDCLKEKSLNGQVYFVQRIKIYKINNIEWKEEKQESASKPSEVRADITTKTSLRDTTTTGSENNRNWQQQEVAMTGRK